MKNQYKRDKNWNKFIILISGIVFAFLLSAISVNAQPIINGDFETGDFTGWTVTGPHSADVVQYQGSWSANIHIGSGNASNGNPDEID